MLPMQIKILLVEDNPGDARLVKEAINDSENPSLYELDQCERLSEAFTKIEQKKYDVLLLDLSLPDSVGIDTFNKLFARNRELPIIVLTGFDDETLAFDSIRDGAQNYLIKGKITSNLLVKSIEYALERAKLMNNLK